MVVVGAVGVARMRSLVQPAVLLCIMYVTVSVAGAAMSSEKEQDIENAIKVLEHLTETRKGLSALKTVVADIDTDLQREDQLGNITRKRKGLNVLKRILGEMDADLIYEQKRMCRFNLGGHCATESAASVADQWHYLNSPLSPGRKRRDTRLYNNLINGKLFQ